MTLKQYQHELETLATNLAKQGKIIQAMGIFLAMHYANRGKVRGLLGRCGITPQQFMKYVYLYDGENPIAWVRYFSKSNGFSYK